MNETLDVALEKAQELRSRLRDIGLAGAKVVVRTRLWDEAPKFVQGDLLKMALREGVNVGNMHAVHALANPERLALVDARHDGEAWNVQDPLGVLTAPDLGVDALTEHAAEQAENHPDGQTDQHDAPTIRREG